MYKPAYLGFLVLDMTKFKMHEFWYDYLIPNYNEKTKLCYMDTYVFIKIFYIKIFQKMWKKDMTLQIMK